MKKIIRSAALIIALVTVISVFSSCSKKSLGIFSRNKEEKTTDQIGTSEYVPAPTPLGGIGGMKSETSAETEKETEIQTETETITEIIETEEVTEKVLSKKEETVMQIEQILEQAEKDGRELDIALSKAETQAEMNEISGKSFKMWDKALNDIWAVINGYLSKEEMDKLLALELVWIDEKDAAIKKAGEPYEGGSIQPLMENSKGTEVSRERSYFLLDYIR